MKSVLSIGNFDGLHVGHRKLLRTVSNHAIHLGLRSVVITYDNHPSEVLNKYPQPLLLMPANHKKQDMWELGIDQIEMIHFDKILAQTSAEEFLEQHIIAKFQPRLIVVGYDSHFGFQRQGNYAFLQEHAEHYGYDLHYIEPVQYQNQVVSSSLIREYLLKGDLALANKLLGRPYRIYGEVVRGSGIGHDLGFPTANMALQDSHQLVPQNGIYFSRVNLGTKRFFGLTIIGISPTLKQSEVIEIETHILDYNKKIYGNSISVELLRYLREEKLFETKEALITAIQNDVAQVRKILAEGRDETV